MTASYHNRDCFITPFTDSIVKFQNLKVIFDTIFLPIFDTWIFSLSVKRIFMIIPIFVQIQRHGMEITTGYNTFRHEHDAIKRPRDYKRLFGQKKVICNYASENRISEVF